MITRSLIVVSVIGLTQIGGSVARGDQEVAQRTFGECFLYRGADGKAYVGHPLVSLGMIGVCGNPPQYYLSSTLAERLAPLVNVLDDTPEKPEFWWWGLPSPKDQNKPLVLLHVETKAELRQAEVMPDFDSSRAVPDHGSPAIYEITSAKLVYAEFISPEWRTAWDSLDESLETVVAVSRMVHGNQKPEHLAEAIEAASQAYTTMVKQDVHDQWRKDVMQIEPAARVVRLFQREVESAEPWQWGGQLSSYVRTLRIEPTTPLPSLPAPCPKLELLAKSPSAADLIRAIRESWPEETLDERLIFSKDLDRTVFVWQVVDLTPAQFDSLRKQAKKELARRQEESTKPSPPSPKEAFSVSEWNVKLRPADDRILTEKGLLRATVVSEVTGDGSRIGLQKGDLLIDYERVYDLVMGAYAPFSPARQLANKARYGGELKVIRGNRLLTIKAVRHR